MSTSVPRLDPPVFPSGAESLRAEVREFLAAERAAGRLRNPDRAGVGYSAEFSERLGARGLIGLTWPKRYGGHERSAFERYVVTEELLAAGAPVSAHWVADRQSGPVLLRFGSDEQREYYLPRIASGKCYFCIGMSEPDSGSDLASLRSRGEKVDGGWLLNGRKVWTTNAHRAHFMITLVRTSPAGENRHAGLSQLIVDMSLPGVTIRPIINMVGQHDFNEVILDDVFVPDASLIGAAGNGWNQVSAELAYERSGPERWLSSYRVLAELIEALGPEPSDFAKIQVGRALAQLLTLRQMSMSIATMLQGGESPGVQAAIVKDIGTRFEQELVRIARDVVTSEELTKGGRARALAALMHSAQAYAPAFTIRGGSSEILRGIIARGLGLR